MNRIRQKNLCLKITIVVYHKDDIKSNAIGTNPIQQVTEVKSGNPGWDRSDTRKEAQAIKTSLRRSETTRYHSL